jgi:hypothetical protein
VRVSRCHPKLSYDQDVSLTFVRVAILATVALVASTAAASAARAPVSDRCPPIGTTRQVGDASAAMAGAFGSIKRLFPRINYGQGRTDPVTRGTTLIREVVELNRATPDALRFRKLAARRCGMPVARQSWAVVAQFPLAPMAATSQIAFFVVDTSNGWKLYGSVLDHG